MGEPTVEATLGRTPVIVLFDKPNFTGSEVILAAGKYPDLTKTEIGIDGLRSVRVSPGPCRRPLSVPFRLFEIFSARPEAVPAYCRVSTKSNAGSAGSL